MNFLADIPGRSRFDLNYDQYMELPVKLRNKMSEQIQKWRAEEDRKK